MQYVKALENPKLKASMRKEIQEKLKDPDIPDNYLFIWEVFWDLFNGERIVYSDILAYANLYHITFSPLELDLIKAMDNVGCRFIADEEKPKDAPKSKGT